MKKKIVSVLLVAAMAVSMFTGCGSKSDSKKSDSKSGEKTVKGKIRLTCWMNWKKN